MGTKTTPLCEGQGPPQHLRRRHAAQLGFGTLGMPWDDGVKNRDLYTIKCNEHICRMEANGVDVETLVRGFNLKGDNRLGV